VFIKLTNAQGESIIRRADLIETVDPIERTEDDQDPAISYVVFEDGNTVEVRESVDQIFERLPSVGPQN